MITDDDRKLGALVLAAAEQYRQSGIAYEGCPDHEQLVAAVERACVRMALEEAERRLWAVVELTARWDAAHDIEVGVRTELAEVRARLRELAEPVGEEAE